MFFNRSKDQIFYQTLIDATINIIDAVELFKQNVETLKEKERYAEELKELESKGDDYTHLLIKELNQTFVTPLDREDILDLAVKLDDIIDGIEACAQRFVSLHVDTPTSYLMKFTEILEKAARYLQEAFVALEKRDFSTIRKVSIEIYALEDEGDRIYFECISELFENPEDPIYLIKMKEIYQRLEEVIDTFEYLMNVMEGVVMKYA